jgi:hypothetical protein
MAMSSSLSVAFILSVAATAFEYHTLSCCACPTLRLCAAPPRRIAPDTVPDTIAAKALEIDAQLSQT